MSDIEQEKITTDIRTIVIEPVIKGELQTRTSEAKLEEAVNLASSIKLDIVQSLIVNLSDAKPSSLIGKGKIEELAEFIKANEIKLAFIDYPLSPIQQRNLENSLKVKVIDRTGLILEIFGARARTGEGKLQVELARLEYQKSRLVKSWTHLERQAGGTGSIGGPGEKQIELDRRIIKDKIAKIKKSLEKVVRTRTLHRSSRQAIPYPVVALVGYTNAGKSTLFNLLTGANVIAEDKLFATLDPTMRLIKLPSKKKVILSDTVGFISNLPTELIAAFRATLEEVIEADLILHVRDIHDEHSDEQRKDVETVTTKLGCRDKMKNASIEVLNKIDLLTPEKIGEINQIARKNTCQISAYKNINIDKLLIMIDEFLARNDMEKSISLNVTDSKILAFIYQNASIISRNDEDEIINLTIKISEKNWQILNSMCN